MNLELQPLINLLDHAKIKKNENKLIEVRLKKSLNTEEYEELANDPFDIQKHTTNKKDLKPLSSTNTAEKGDILFIDVPRQLGSCVVAKDLNDLLSIHGAFQKQPKELILLQVTNNERSFFHTGQESKPQIIQAYESAVKVSSLLISIADHKSPTNNWVTFFDVHKLRIDLAFTAQDLQWVFPYNEVNDFINESTLDAERMEVFKSTLWSLKNC